MPLLAPGRGTVACQPGFLGLGRPMSEQSQDFDRNGAVRFLRSFPQRGKQLLFDDDHEGWILGGLTATHAERSARENRWWTLLDSNQ